MGCGKNSKKSINYLNTKIKLFSDTKKSYKFFS